MKNNGYERSESDSLVGRGWIQGLGEKTRETARRFKIATLVGMIGLGWSLSGCAMGAALGGAYMDYESGNPRNSFRKQNSARALSGLGYTAAGILAQEESDARNAALERELRERQLATDEHKRRLEMEQELLRKEILIRKIVNTTPTGPIFIKINSGEGCYWDGKIWRYEHPEGTSYYMGNDWIKVPKKATQ